MSSEAAPSTVPEARAVPIYDDSWAAQPTATYVVSAHSDAPQYNHAIHPSAAVPHQEEHIIQHPYSTMEDNNGGAESVLISIIPGVNWVQITTLYVDPLIVLYSRLVIHIASTLLFLQLLWGLLFLLATSHANLEDFLFNFAFSIAISVLVFGCAVKGVRFKNPTCCCGFGYLDFYAAWSTVGCVLSTIYAVLGIIAGSIFAFIFNISFAILYFIGVARTRRLLEALTAVSENSNQNIVNTV